MIILILIIIVHSQEWSQPLAIIAEDTARSCSNEPASKNILSAAVGSELSWVGENRQLISSAVQVNQSVLNQVLSCWLTGTADCQYKETNRVQVSYCQTGYHLNEFAILEIFGSNNYHIILTSWRMILLSTKCAYFSDPFIFILIALLMFCDTNRQMYKENDDL